MIRKAIMMMMMMKLNYQFIYSCYKLKEFRDFSDIFVR